MTSHQVDGWNDFPIVRWVGETLGLAAVLQNDADTAALAEAQYGAGRGFDPVFYVTVGSGIGGGLILGGKVYRGSGRGAAEIGHLRPGHVPQHLPYPGTTVEQVASGFGITQRDGKRWPIAPRPHHSPPFTAPVMRRPHLRSSNHPRPQVNSWNCAATSRGISPRNKSPPRRWRAIRFAAGCSTMRPTPGLGDRTGRDAGQSREDRDRRRSVADGGCVVL